MCGNNNAHNSESVCWPGVGWIEDCNRRNVLQIYFCWRLAAHVPALPCGLRSACSPNKPGSEQQYLFLSRATNRRPSAVSYECNLSGPIFAHAVHWTSLKRWRENVANKPKMCFNIFFSMAYKSWGVLEFKLYSAIYRIFIQVNFWSNLVWIGRLFCDQEDQTSMQSPNTHRVEGWIGTSKSTTKE